MSLRQMKELEPLEDFLKRCKKEDGKTDQRKKGAKHFKNGWVTKALKKTKVKEKIRKRKTW